MEGSLYKRRHTRRPTYPLAHAARQKPRRIPLVLRFAKGAIHNIILIPVLLHSLFTVLIVYLDRNVAGSLGVPATVIPSLSIVVGLMLVFRNSTSYDRFWSGRNCLTTIGTSVRNLARGFLVNAHRSKKEGGGLTDAEKKDTEKIIRVLIAIMYAVKHNLRAEFNIPPVPLSTSSSSEEAPIETSKAEYFGLLPDGLMGYEDQGLSLPLQLTVLVESYIRRGFDRGWFNAPQSSGLSAQINSLVDAYGKMETIRSTPIPVAHLIHQKQVLALFNCILPFATVDDFGWYAVPIVAIVSFTLYGIEGIGVQLEDPFGHDKNDIKMDGIIEDTRQEVMVLLEEWKMAADGHAERMAGGMFDF
ncbi:uncharacterized protein BDR25DRAFT_326488 [Lindgomyces ingoldianus]|uniref:Uncharacterized protein n=1 Tax=Lindgomyces ingoldianus TaxID=673940 RepID=A0ACB6QPG3_9PLEO|nr:uncharacterized protein BDR25DRAFT_326488 [Lindgomyces ingoldianus]KAF2468765.1 hypothetical protein BDR25DRAFT_326488 [Lindgomyces ingoldianus]